MENSNSVEHHEDLTLYLASSIHEIKNAFFRLQFLSEEHFYNLPEEFRNELEYHRLQFEAKHISTQLTQLLITYKNNENGYKAHPEEIIMEDYFEEISARHHTLLSMLNIELTMEVEDSLIAAIDENLVTNAIDTLIYNATQAKASKIKVTCETKGDFVIITIEDNGPGFPDDILNTEFKRNTPTQFCDGKTGLGLYFTQRITQMHQVKAQKGFTKFSNGSFLNGASIALSFPI